MRYAPLPWVSAVRVSPVVVLGTLIDTPGRTPPLGSERLPRNAPVAAVWANSDLPFKPNSRQRSSTRITTKRHGLGTARSRRRDKRGACRRTSGWGAVSSPNSWELECIAVFQTPRIWHLARRISLNDDF